MKWRQNTVAISNLGSSFISHPYSQLFKNASQTFIDTYSDFYINRSYAVPQKFDFLPKPLILQEKLEKLRRLLGINQENGFVRTGAPNRTIHDAVIYDYKNIREGNTFFHVATYAQNDVSIVFGSVKNEVCISKKLFSL